MNAHEHDDATTKVEPDSKVGEGVKRLRLSVTRMKRLRSGVAGGNSGDPESTAPTSWT
jgi:hypothetical protein